MMQHAHHTCTKLSLNVAIPIPSFVLGRSGVWGVGREFVVVRVREFGRCKGALTLSRRDTPLGLEAWLDIWAFGGLNIQDLLIDVSIKHPMGTQYQPMTP